MLVKKFRSTFSSEMGLHDVHFFGSFPGFGRTTTVALRIELGIASSMLKELKSLVSIGIKLRLGSCKNMRKTHLPPEPCLAQDPESPLAPHLV